MTQIYTRAFVPPLQERSSIFDQNRDHYITREAQPPVNTSPLYLDSQRKVNEWKTSQPHSPMSDSQKGSYEVSPTKAADMYQSRSETTSKPLREQLPPLSSLFGSAPPQSRPLPSSYSDKQSPVFPAVSPHDPRHPATPIHPDRPYDSGSYFQRPPPTRQYSYNSRPEVERLGIPPPPPPRPGQGRPESPRYDSRYGGPEIPRTQGAPSVNGWSPHSQPGRGDFFPRDTSSSFRTHQEHHQHSNHRLESEQRPLYREGVHSAPVTPTYPPTPAATVAGDAATGKDGLGPKIWTGTQFLPRFVRQAEVPGEGMCYFYDDGTHCKTVIDGEIVNAHWGVTKAGKPRKRLAIACITCREKKIKCDPDYPRCVQCEKFGRICKFKNAPRGGHGSPDTPPADPEESVSRPASSRADLESFKGEKREGSHSVSPRQTLRQGTPDSETHHSKRQRNGYNDFTPVTSDASPHPSVAEVASPTTPWAEPSSIVSPSTLIREWNVNPYHTQPALVTELVSVFFSHVPETVYCMFPEGPFRNWVISNVEKSADDLMLIYSLLALGAIFSLNPEHKPFGAQYEAIARYANDNSRFSLQLVQARLLLALCSFSTNKAEEAWDLTGAALRTASALKLNLEIEKSDDAYLKVFPFGLTRAGYAESRRRTFWSCYITDRFNGFCNGHVSVLHPEDVFLRLPCDGASFEAQSDVQNPFFDPISLPTQNSHWTIGSMAYLVNIATVWGDVMANIYRTSHRPNSSISRSNFTSSYDSASRRLRAWHESLPSCYTFSAENITRAANKGQLGTFMTMHATYHTTAMKLNRYIQLYTLTKSQQNHHVAIAKQHAEEFLKMMDILTAKRSSPSASPRANGNGSMPAKFSSPFVAYGIVSAIDILTAKLPASSILFRLSSFTSAQAVLSELALFWQSARNQAALVGQRIRDLRAVEQGEREAEVGRMMDDNWEMREPIEKTFSREYDCVYA